MFCQSCGTQLPEGVTFCSNCGAPVADSTAQQPAAAQPVSTVPQPTAAPQQPYNAVPQPVNTVPQPTAAPQQPYNAAPQQPYYGAPQQPNAYPFNNQGFVQQLPMNWFKFVIYFQLFANAVLNLINAIMYFTGLHYGGGYMTAAVYMFYGGLKPLDIVTGILTIGLVAIAIYTRFRLSGFKKNAIMCLMITYGANILVALIWLIGVVAITGVGEVIGASTIISLVGNIVLIILSAVYFNKRKHLFVN